MLGMHGTVTANYAVNEADLLLAFGARFDDRVTGERKSHCAGWYQCARCHSSCRCRCQLQLPPAASLQQQQLLTVNESGCVFGGSHPCC